MLNGGGEVLESVAERRLTAILAVDVAGYSASSERDEGAAVRGIDTLSRLIDQEAAIHGGRVFNTAGDGFMLEFPTVSGALAAAEAIALKADPPVRVGVHLGEVAVTPRGDLLGHGVNVAARLQALAQPGSVLVSDAVKRALVGPAADRLKPQGRVRLDKMSQSAEVFVLNSGGKPGIRRKRPWLAPVLAVAAALVVCAGGLLYWRLAAPHPLTVAVEPFQATGPDPVLKSLAEGMVGGIGSGLADRQTLTVPLDTAASPGRGGARLLVVGQARGEGDKLAVDVQLVDRRGGVVLWSSNFERSAAEAQALRDQVTAKVVDVVSTAMAVLNDPHVRVDSETMTAILKLMDMQRYTTLKADESIGVARQLIRIAPQLSMGHSNLARDLALSLNGRSPEVAKAMEAEARKESAIALQLDPHNSDAYYSIYNLLKPGDYVGREALLNTGLASEPQGAAVNNAMADFLREVGRVREAEPFYRRSLALDPLSPAKTATSIFALAGTGRAAESRSLANHALELFPTSRSVGRAAAYTAALYQPPDVALKTIDAVERLGPSLTPEAADLWRVYVKGARMGRVDPAAMRRFREAAVAGLVDASNAAMALSLVGDVDGALLTIDRGLARREQIYPSDFFESAATPMRRDPRFMDLMKRLGIAGYWRQSGKWPDFCAEPGLPYVCKAAA